MQEVVVRYLSLPDIEDGVAGFYKHYHDKRCVEPSKSYSSGRCHTTGYEIDELAAKVGFMTRKEYAVKRKSQKYSNWKNAYGSELSMAIGKALETKGLIWNINGHNILFRCPRGEFVGWPWRKHV
ncbi:hypothetical protein [Priestia aryabhattai]